MPVQRNHVIHDAMGRLQVIIGQGFGTNARKSVYEMDDVIVAGPHRHGESLVLLGH